MNSLFKRIKFSPPASSRCHLILKSKSFQPSLDLREFIMLGRWESR